MYSYYLNMQCATYEHAALCIKVTQHTLINHTAKMYAEYGYHFAHERHPWICIEWKFHMFPCDVCTGHAHYHICTGHTVNWPFTLPWMVPFFVDGQAFSCEHGQWKYAAAGIAFSFYLRWNRAWNTTGKCIIVAKHKLYQHWKIYLKLHIYTVGSRNTSVPIS